MPRRASILLSALLSALAAEDIAAADPPAEVRSILRRFDVFRPGDADLAMYRLDWAPTLDAALETASRDGRPVLLVVIHAKYGDLASGHC